MSDIPVVERHYGQDQDEANIVNDKMSVLRVGNRKPAIAGDDVEIDYVTSVARDMVEGKMDRMLGEQAIEKAILLAEANQAELLADFDILRRSAFNRRLDSYIKGLKKDPDPEVGGLALMMTDGNGLKSINDSTSHATGDKFIRMWADVLTSKLRQGRGDVFFQYGSGDEIGGMLPFKSQEEAISMLEGAKGRIPLIKSEIEDKRDQYLAQEPSFPDKKSNPKCGTLAIGWFWLDNDRILKMYDSCNGDINKLVGFLYEQADKNMYMDKGDVAR